MRKHISLIVFFALAPLALLAQKKPVTLDDLMRERPAFGAGTPTAWAPDGKSFLYRQGRNVMLYDIASSARRQVASLEALDSAAVKVPPAERFAWVDRRTHESTLQYFPSGKDLLLVEGGDLFVWHLDSGKWEQLTKTPVAERDPKISPDGKHVSFVRNYDIYCLDVASGKETRLTTGGSETLRNGEVDWVYPEELSLGTAYWWSPDSQSLVYLQFDIGREPLFPHADFLKLRAVYEPERYPQAGENNADVRVGVVAAAGGPTRWFDVGDTRRTSLIARAGWMPDSRHVYMVRTNRVQNHLELVSMDAATRAFRTILTESDPYWVNVHDDPRFLKDGRRFLWSSERDGFRHLYLVSIDGGDGKQLTKGSWEVRSLAGVDETGGRIFYTSSEVSPVETQFYSVKLDGTDKRRLSEGAGTHSVAMAPTGQYYLDTYSSLESPSRTTIHQADGAQLGVYREADRKPLEEFDILPVQILSFRTKDGTLLYARLIKPANFQSGKKYPAIVMVYGGPGVFSVRNAWAGLTWDQVLAHRGFVIWQVDNRGGSGRGHAFETPVYHKLGKLELSDQREGVEHLLAMGFVDPARIGVYGWSYGGFMTLNLMLNAADLFHAGAAGAPVTQWVNYDTIYTERYMGLPDENPEGYAETALPPRAANLKGKLMIVHNFEDDNVLFQNSMQMIDALQRAGKEFEFMLYPQKSHGVTGPVRRQLNQSLTDFFERNLK